MDEMIYINQINFVANYREQKSLCIGTHYLYYKIRIPETASPFHHQ
jgi:hypothetical protein